MSQAAATQAATVAVGAPCGSVSRRGGWWAAATRGKGPGARARRGGRRLGRGTLDQAGVDEDTQGIFPAAYACVVTCEAATARHSFHAGRSGVLGRVS